MDAKHLVDWRAWARRENVGDAMSLSVAADHLTAGGRQPYHAMPMVIKPHTEGAFVAGEECLLLGRSADVTSFLQAMVDAAWEVGIRPRSDRNRDAEIEAVRYHLEDMRTLAKVNR